LHAIVDVHASACRDVTVCGDVGLSSQPSITTGKALSRAGGGTAGLRYADQPT